MATKIIIPSSKIQEFVDDTTNVDIELSGFRHETRQSTYEWESTSGPDDTDYRFETTVNDDLIIESDDYVSIDEYNKLKQEYDDQEQELIKLRARLEEQAQTIIRMGTQLQKKRSWWSFLKFW